MPNKRKSYGRTRPTRSPRVNIWRGRDTCPPCESPPIFSQQNDSGEGLIGRSTGNTPEQDPFQSRDNELKPTRVEPIETKSLKKKRSDNRDKRKMLNQNHLYA
ncbi:hypothetical protein Bca4012_074135 [Brassica carinata]